MFDPSLFVAVSVASCLNQSQVVDADVVFADLSRAAEYVDSNRNHPFETAPVQASLVCEQDMNSGRLSVTFHRIWVTEDANRNPVWLARLRATDGRKGWERFADSRTCPAVEGVLGLAEQIERPVYDFPGIPDGAMAVRSRPNPEAGPNAYLHGARYGFSAKAVFLSGDTQSDMSIGGDAMTPLGAFSRTALAALASCWAGERPEMNDATSR